MDRDKKFTDFIGDTLELMLEIKAALLRLQRSPTDAAIASTVPCATRAIKRLADFHGCQQIVAFSCVFEGTLSRVRNTELHAEPDLIALLISCCDHVSEMASHLADGDSAPLSMVSAEYLGKSLDLILQLRAHHSYRQHIKRPDPAAIGAEAALVNSCITHVRGTRC